jgi:hypothetical protein
VNGSGAYESQIGPQSVPRRYDTTRELIAAAADIIATTIRETVVTIEDHGVRRVSSRWPKRVSPRLR